VAELFAKDSIVAKFSKEKMPHNQMPTIFNKKGAE
jgi:hypothetical protein